MTRWLEPVAVELPTWVQAMGLHPLVSQTLVRRGLQDASSAQAFLHPQAAGSAAFPGIERAVATIQLAIRNGTRIAVWGDFDVDGQTSTTLLMQALQALGADVTHYIPVRGNEGHGVHVDTLAPLLDGGTGLLVTCDTGITAHDAVRFAKGRGVAVVVTDHHDPGKTLPDADAIVNPKLLPADHPLASLAGVGVAYKLAEALANGGRLAAEPGRRHAQALHLEQLLDLVALGLVADVASLRGETRSLVQRGITALRHTQRRGLQEIAELSGTNLATLNEETIGFAIAPRLNALGRLSDANQAVELLLTQDPLRARVLGSQVEALNAQRRLLTGHVVEAAEVQLSQNPALLFEPAIVLSHADWPGGVLGLVASQLVERYHKPALLLTQSEDGMLRGSARSVEGVHITEAIATQEALLTGFGGHPMAAGVSLPADHLREFRHGLGRAVAAQLGEAVPEEPALQLDAWVELASLSSEFAAQLEQLAPFGAGNPALVLASRDLTLVSSSPLGKTGEHRRLVVADSKGSRQEVLWWNAADSEPPDGRFDLAYTVRQNSYRGEQRVQLQLKETRRRDDLPVLAQKPSIELADLRGQLQAFPGLRASAFVEGEHGDQVPGFDRYGIAPAEVLVFYSTPPGPAELRNIVARAKPKTILVIAAPTAAPDVEAFLGRLAGMAKFALNQRGGELSMHPLAAATSQREATVRLGLEWLAAGGHIQIESSKNELQLTVGTGTADPYAQKELFVAVRGLLAETAAYRAHFAGASLESLFEL